MEFKLKAEFIELDNMLKVLGFAGSGSEAKQIIQSKAVKVNGEVESRVRRKLRAGDVVEFDGKSITVSGEPLRRDFDKEAAVWDSPPRIELARDIAAAITAAVTLTPDMDVLDFGCGTGLLSLALRPRARSVTGADPSQGMLEVFAAKAAAAKLTQVETLLLDPETRFQPEKHFHLIVSSMTLHHVRELEPLFVSFYESLLPGGRVALADLDLDDGEFHAKPEGVFHNGFDRAEIARMLAAAGFKDARCEQAAAVTKPLADGTSRTFTIFLATAKK